MEDIPNQNSYQLCRKADEILHNAEFDIFGIARSEKNYLQSRFENSMQTGAYRNNSERRRK